VDVARLGYYRDHARFKAASTFRHWNKLPPSQTVGKWKHLIYSNTQKQDDLPYRLFDGIGVTSRMMLFFRTLRKNSDSQAVRQSLSVVKASRDFLAALNDRLEKKKLALIEVEILLLLQEGCESVHELRGRVMTPILSPTDGRFESWIRKLFKRGFIESVGAGGEGRIWPTDSGRLATAEVLAMWNCLFEQCFKNAGLAADGEVPKAPRAPGQSEELARIVCQNHERMISATEFATPEWRALREPRAYRNPRRECMFIRTSLQQAAYQYHLGKRYCRIDLFLYDRDRERLRRVYADLLKAAGNQLVREGFELVDEAVIEQRKSLNISLSIPVSKLDETAEIAVKRMRRLIQLTANHLKRLA
jgi:hypothetical protein